MKYFQVKLGVWSYVNYQDSRQEWNTVARKLIRGYGYLTEITPTKDFDFEQLKQDLQEAIQEETKVLD
jgi:hypothetical protein